MSAAISGAARWMSLIWEISARARAHSRLAPLPGRHDHTRQMNRPALHQSRRASRPHQPHTHTYTPPGGGVNRLRRLRALRRARNINIHLQSGVSRMDAQGGERKSVEGDKKIIFILIHPVCVCVRA